MAQMLLSHFLDEKKEGGEGRAQKSKMENALKPIAFRAGCCEQCQCGCSVLRDSLEIIKSGVLKIEGIEGLAKYYGVKRHFLLKAIDLAEKKPPFLSVLNKSVMHASEADIYFKYLATVQRGFLNGVFSGKE